MICSQRVLIFRNLRVLNTAVFTSSHIPYTGYRLSRYNFSTSKGDLTDAVTKLTAVKKAKQMFDWKDSLLLRDQLTEEERLIQDAANGFVEQHLMPRYNYRIRVMIKM